MMGERAERAVFAADDCATHVHGGRIPSGFACL